MFYYLYGKKANIGGGKAVIDVGGAGFLLNISDRTAGILSASNDEFAKLYTYMNVSENAIDLFGFSDEEELHTFKMLIGVSGIGPRAALAILSVMTPERFALCVLSDDAKSISAAQGVGLKTAQKVILELKDKISKNQFPSGAGARMAFSGKNEPSPSGDGIMSEAISALVVLGYTRIEAASALGSVAGDGMTLEKLIKEGLKRLNSDR